jgi:hypothetical protein
MFLLVAKSSLDGCCLATYVPRMYIYRVFHHYFTPNTELRSENVHRRLSATRLSKYFKIPTPWGKRTLFQDPRFNDSNTRGTILSILLVVQGPAKMPGKNAIWFVRLNLDYRSLACSHVLRTRWLRLTLYSIVWLWNYVLEYRRLKISFYSYPCYDLIIFLTIYNVNHVILLY